MAGPLLTYSKAAETLAVSKRTIERLVAEGELPVVRIGGARRITVDDVEAFIERQRTTAARSAGSSSVAVRLRRGQSSFRTQLHEVS